MIIMVILKLEMNLVCRLKLNIYHQLDLEPK